MLLHLNDRPFNISLIQFSSFTIELPDEKREQLYNWIKEIHKRIKRNDINTIMGDLNAKVRDKNWERWISSNEWST